MKLYGYWRSSCTWRVRIALAFKGLPHEVVPVHLVRAGGEQHQPLHQSRNPMGQVPVLETRDGRRLSQSMAILEYLEENYPVPSLLPTQPYERAHARQLAEMVNAGIQPLQNLAVLRRLEEVEGLDAHHWARHFIEAGLDAMEREVAHQGGDFLVGDWPSFAEVCLVPQLYNARRFGCGLSRWPRLLRAEAAALTVSAFAGTHPDHQPDAVKAA